MKNKTRLSIVFENNKFIKKELDIPENMDFNTFATNICDKLNKTGTLNQLLLGDAKNGYLYFTNTGNLLKIFTPSNDINDFNISPNFFLNALNIDSTDLNKVVKFSEISLLIEHPEMYNFLPINSDARVKEFFEFIVNVLDINFHPDSSFNDYIDEKGNQTFDELTSDWLDTLMSVCFKISGDKVYDLGFDILKKRVYTPIENPIDGDEGEFNEWQVNQVKITIENYFDTKSTVLPDDFLNLANVINSVGLSLPEKYDEETANVILEFTKGKPLFAESILSLTETLYNYYKTKFGGNVDNTKQFTEKLSYQQLLKVDYLHPQQYELIKDDEKFKTSHWNFDSVRNLYIRKKNNEIENQRKASPYQIDKKMSQQMKDKNILGHKVFDYITYGGNFNNNDNFIFENREDFNKTFNKISKEKDFIDASHSELVIKISKDSLLYTKFIGKFRKNNDETITGF